MNNEYLSNLFKLAPICINAELGDPFQPTQWEGTRRRLLELVVTGHIGPVGLITKSIVSDEQIAWLNYYTRKLNLTVFFSVTGLTERYSLETTLNGIKNFFEKSTSAKNTIFIRPIIPGKNDDIEKLRPIIETASHSTTGGTVIFRSYKDIETDDFKTTVLDKDFIEKFHKLCDSYNVSIIGRTKEYPMFLGWPSLFQWKQLTEDDANEFLKLIGYDDILVIRDGLIRQKAEYDFSKGDLHFVEMFTKFESDPTIKRNMRKEALSRHVFGYHLDATSSWLEWGENKPCMIGCPYCIADANPEQKKYKLFGTNFDTIIDQQNAGLY
jgi:hypothetical protein